MDRKEELEILIVSLRRDLDQVSFSHLRSERYPVLYKAEIDTISKYLEEYIALTSQD